MRLIIEALMRVAAHLFRIKKLAGIDFVILPRPNSEMSAGSHYDMETVDIVAGHVAGLFVIDEGVKGLTLEGPHL